MITVYTNPIAMDFISVAINLSQNERDNLEAMTGEPYEVDGCALGAFMQPGPKWAFHDSTGVPLVVGGFVPQRPGVWRDFMLTTPAAWSEANWFAVSRNCRRIMDHMLTSGAAHRLECVTSASRTNAHKWYRILGYKKEARLHKHCADGSDAVIFSRVE